MKLNSILRVPSLLEGRQSELTYTEKKVKDKVDRVIVELKGRQSEKFTKLTEHYKNLKDSIDELNAQKDRLNERVKSEILELFDAEDEVYTRVIDTISATMTLSKKTMVKKTTVDYESILVELIKMVPDLNSRVEELKVTYTKIKEEEKSPALRVDIKEGMMDIFKSIKRLAKNAITKIFAWANSYDKKLKKIQLALQ
jgi:hypothetical protein